MSSYFLDDEDLKTCVEHMMRSRPEAALTLKHASFELCAPESKIEFAFYKLYKENKINIYAYGREIYAKLKRTKKKENNQS